MKTLESKTRRASRAWLAILAILTASLAAFVVAPAYGQEPERSFDQTAAAVQQDLESALAELARLRQEIAAEKLPLSRELSQLEKRLSEARRENEDLSRQLDNQNLDVSNLTTKLEARRGERGYISNLLDEYVRNFQIRVHVAELQRYREVVERAQNAPQIETLSGAEVYEAQVAMVEASIGRLDEMLGGASFAGTAIGAGGLVEDVDYAIVGPVALYATDVGAGIAMQQIGSLEPNMAPFERGGDVAAVQAVVRDGTGSMPFDPTLGNARAVEATQESLIDHAAKGGPVMVPILLMAAASLCVALWKLIQLMRVPMPSQGRIRAMLDAVRQRDFPGVRQRAQKMPGPTGEMLRVGVEHIDEPRDLVEEVMFESMLETRLKLQSMLPFVQICAAAAPLLGLLGTVTGIINTFKLITVFGTGDPKTLSSGISEALITTEFGLIIAIPSLLLHAFLSRKARRMIDGMEKVAVGFVNRLAISSAAAVAEPAES